MRYRGVVVLLGITILLNASGAEPELKATGPKQPQLQRTSPNLMPNPALLNDRGWVLQDGGAFDPTTTRTPGSGSMRLSALHARAIAPVVPVTPGKDYTFSAHMRSSVFPTEIVVQAAVIGPAGKFIANRYTTRVYPSKADTWEELTILFRAQPGESAVRIHFFRIESPDNDGSIWIDDLYAGEGFSFESPPAPKKAFDGQMVRIDSLGNFEVSRSGTWTPFFPFCIYENPQTDFSIYSNQGFNCVVFNSWKELGIFKRAKEAVSHFNPQGMMAMAELGHILDPRVPATFNDLGLLERSLRALAASPLKANLLAFYWDFEQWKEYDLPKKAIELIRKYDVDERGQRLHPIWLHAGNYSMARGFNDLVDTVGSYANEPVPLQDPKIQLMSNFENQRNPYGISVISTMSEPPELLRARVYKQLVEGARGIAFYKDPNNDSHRPLPQCACWPEFSRLRQEIDKLLPILRTPAWSSVRLTPSLPQVMAGIREFNGNAYAIVLNTTSETCTPTFVLSGLSAKIAGDFFQADSAAKLEGDRFTVTLPAYGVAVYKFDGALPSAAPSTRTALPAPPAPTFDPQPHRDALALLLQNNALKKEKVNLTIMGRQMDVTLDSTNSAGVRVLVDGNLMPMRWKDIGDEDLIQVAIACGSAEPEVLFHAGALAHCSGLVKLLQKISGKLIIRDIALAHKLDQLCGQ